MHKPQPNRPPIDQGTWRETSAGLESTGTIGDFEITVTGQNQEEQSRSGGINTTIKFSIKYVGATYDNPQSKLAFSGYGSTELLYTTVIFGCDDSPIYIDERLSTGGSIDATICFTVHPDDADVLSLGISTTEEQNDTLWLATTEESVAGPSSVPTTTGVDVVLRDDFSITPNEISIPADTDVAFTVTNMGFMQHDFAIEDTGLETELLNGGDSQLLIVNLPAGEYAVICSVAGHAPAGMVATLIVE